MDLQIQNGVEMGSRYRSRYGARKIVEVVSATMHKKLLEFLKQQDKPFSLIVDATTNTQNIPFFVVYIMTLEFMTPVVYFYRLVELTEGEGSKATFKSFMDHVNADNTISFLIMQRVWLLKSSPS